jgi:hypothetical protein
MCSRHSEMRVPKAHEAHQSLRSIGHYSAQCQPSASLRLGTAVLSVRPSGGSGGQCSVPAGTVCTVGRDMGSLRPMAALSMSRLYCHLVSSRALAVHARGERCRLYLPTRVICNGRHELFSRPET